jgi:archaemetzincin
MLLHKFQFSITNDYLISLNQNIMKASIYYVTILVLILLNSSCLKRTDNNLAIQKEQIITVQKRTTIGIQPYGDFDKSLIDTIKSIIGEVYDFEVKILKSKPLPKTAFVTIKSPRYRADSLIRILKREKPNGIDYVLGLTEVDISTTKRDKNGNIKKPVYKYIDWGLFGLGYVSGPTCIVSTFRLKSTNQEKFIERLKKLCIHEIGHNLGLYHCNSNQNCILRDAAETIKTIDFVELSLCSECKSKIGL